MRTLSVVAVVFSLLSANVAMAEYDHAGVVTGSESNVAANSGPFYAYGSRPTIAAPADAYAFENGPAMQGGYRAHEGVVTSSKSNARANRSADYEYRR